LHTSDQEKEGIAITSQNHLALGITTIPSIKHESYTILTSHQTSSTSLPGLLLCWSKNYIAFFFSRFVVHQIVLQCVFFSQFVVHQIVFYFVVPGLVCLLGIVAGGFSAMFAIFNLS